MSIKKILYFKYVSIVLLYFRYSFALFLNIFNPVSETTILIIMSKIFGHGPWGRVNNWSTQIIILSLTMIASLLGPFTIFNGIIGYTFMNRVGH